MSEKTWLCKNCSQNSNHFHLAGITKRCELCGWYAWSLFEKVGDKWEVAILNSVDL